MQRGELGRHHREQLVDNLNEREIQDQYPEGTLVTVWDEGEWKVGRVEGGVRIEDGKFVAFIQPQIEKNVREDSAKITETSEPADAFDLAAEKLPYDEQIDHPLGPFDVPREMKFNHVPEKLSFEVNKERNFDNPGKSGIDGERDATFIVTGVDVLNDGSVEYRILSRAGKGKKNAEVAHIPQELLELWRDVAKLEHELRQLESSINNHVVVALRKDLLARVLDVEHIVAEAYKHLPDDISQIGKTEKYEIDRIATAIKDVHFKASQALGALSIEVERGAERTRLDATTARDISETDYEKEAREKRNKPRREFIEQFEAMIEEEYKGQIDKINDEEKKAIQQAVEKAKKAFEAANKSEPEPVEKKDEKAAGGKSAKAKPAKTEFDPSSVSLDARSKEKFEERRKGVKNSIFETALENVKKQIQREGTAAGVEFDFYCALDDKRREIASRDRLTPDTEMLGDRHDYNPDSEVFIDKQMLAYDELAAEWNPYEDEKKKNIFEFNFDAVRELSQEAEQLLARIPRESDSERPQSAFASLYNQLREFQQRTKTNHDYWARPAEEINTSENVRKQREAGGKLTDEQLEKEMLTQEALNEMRVHMYTNELIRLHDIRKRLEAVLGPETKVAEPVDATKSQTTEQEKTPEKKIGYVNIPEQILREALFEKGSRLFQFKEAMHHIYKEVSEGHDKLSGHAIDELRKLIPSKPDAALLETFRPYGVRNWEQLKSLWDTHMVERFGETLRVSADAKFKTKIAEKVTWLKKTLKFKGEITVRILTGVVVIGGVGFAASALAAGAGFWTMFTTLVGGGAVGGGLRAWFHKYFFDNSEAKEKAVQKMKDLYQEVTLANSDDVINQLVDAQFGGHHGEADYKHANAKLDRLPELTAIMADTIKEVSKEQASDDPEEVRGLSGDARAAYERALRSLEPKDRTEKAKRDLAVAISKIISKGEALEEATYKSMDPLVINSLDTLFGDLAGKRGVVRGAVTGAFVPAFFVVSGAGRAALGAVAGAVQGYKMTKEKGIEAMREESKEAVLADLTKFKEWTSGYRTGDLTTNNESQYKHAYQMLKKVLHGALPPEYVRAFYVEEEMDQFGKAADERNKLITQIKIAIQDAENLGIHLEAQEDEETQKSRLHTTLEQLKAAQADVKHIDPKAQEVIKKELAKSVEGTEKGIVVGAIVGAAATWTLGKLLSWGGRHVGEWIQTGKNSVKETIADVIDAVQHNEQHAGAQTTQSEITAVAGAGSPPAEGHSSSASEPPTDRPEDVPPPPEKRMTAAEVPENPALRKQELVFAELEKANIIKSGQGTINALNRFDAGSRSSLVDEIETKGWTAQQKVAWDKMQNDFDGWKKQELHDMGYRWKDGKLLHPMNVLKGAEMKLFFDPNGGDEIVNSKGEVVGHEGRWHGRFSEFQLDKDGNAILDKSGKPIQKIIGYDYLHEHEGGSTGTRVTERIEEVPPAPPEQKATVRTEEEAARANARQTDTHAPVRGSANGEDVSVKYTDKAGHEHDVTYDTGAKSVSRTIDVAQEVPVSVNKGVATAGLEAMSNMRPSGPTANAAAEMRGNVSHGGGGGSSESSNESATRIKTPEAKRFLGDFLKQNVETRSGGDENVVKQNTQETVLDKVKKFAEDVYTQTADQVPPPPIVEVQDNVPAPLDSSESVPPSPADKNEWVNPFWKARFIEDGGEITGMELEGAKPMPEETARKVFINPEGTLVAIHQHKEGGALFEEFGKSLQVYEDMKTNLQSHTEQAEFLKFHMAETLDKLVNELGVDRQIFIPSFLENIGLASKTPEA